MRLVSSRITEVFKLEAPRLDYGAFSRASTALDIDATILSHIKIGSTHRISLDKLLDIAHKIGIRVSFTVE